MDNVTFNVNTGSQMPAGRKSPLLAAIGSFFLPGLGQVYNGEGILKGLLYMIAISIGYLIFILPGFALWLYGIYNAYSVANRMNLGQLPYRHASGLAIVGFIILVFAIYFIVALIVVMFSAVITAFIFAMAGSSY
jgi:hypothetical protein